MNTRDRDFAQRLAKACDGAPSVPPISQGRQAYVALKMGASAEAASKWFTGRSRPRAAAMTKLAKLLGVDTAWLAFGQEPALSRREATLATKRTEGVVYLSMGMAILNGASCARPTDTDPRKSFVDYYMILDGEQIAVRNSLGREVNPGEFEFTVPREFKEVRNLGFVSANGTRTHILDMKPALIEKHKKNQGDQFSVIVKQHAGGVYTSGKDEWDRVSSIGELV